MDHMTMQAYYHISKGSIKIQESFTGRFREVKFSPSALQKTDVQLMTMDFLCFPDTLGVRILTGFEIIPQNLEDFRSSSAAMARCLTFLARFRTFGFNRLSLWAAGHCLWAGAVRGQPSGGELGRRFRERLL